MVATPYGEKGIGSATLAGMPTPRPDLASVRRARGCSQTDIARALKTAQADVSKLEHRADPRLSTLIKYAEALGGVLELHVRFDEGVLPLSYRGAQSRGRGRAGPHFAGEKGKR